MPLTAVIIFTCVMARAGSLPEFTVGSLSRSTSIMVPTERFAAEDTVKVVEPFAPPPVIAVPSETLPPAPPKFTISSPVRKVLSAPAPRKVTLLWLTFIVPPSDAEEYVPALRNTTPLLHEPIAALIWVAVAPGLKVAQMVVRFGIPPGTPV